MADERMIFSKVEPKKAQEKMKRAQTAQRGGRNKNMTLEGLSRPFSQNNFNNLSSGQQ